MYFNTIIKQGKIYMLYAIYVILITIDLYLTYQNMFFTIGMS